MWNADLVTQHMLLFRIRKVKPSRAAFVYKAVVRALTSGPLCRSLTATSALHKQTLLNTQNPNVITDHCYFSDT